MLCGRLLPGIGNESSIVLLWQTRPIALPHDEAAGNLTVRPLFEAVGGLFKGAGGALERLFGWRIIPEKSQ